MVMASTRMNTTSRLSVPFLVCVTLGVALVTFGITVAAFSNNQIHKQEAIFRSFAAATAASQTALSDLGPLQKKIFLSFGTYQGLDTAIVSCALGLIAIVCAYYLSSRPNPRPEA